MGKSSCYPTAIYCLIKSSIIFIGTLIIPLLLLFSTGFSVAQTTPAKTYSTLDYLTINPKLPSNPDIKEFFKGNKQIVFCGVEHADPTDTTSAMYAAIDQKFYKVKPGVELNECGNMDGGQIFIKEPAPAKKRRDRINQSFPLLPSSFKPFC